MVTGTSVTPFGAVSQIGGNAFLIESSNEIVLIDYGKDFHKYRRFFEFPFILPTHSIRRELVKTELLPCLRDSSGRPLSVNMEYEDDILSEPREECRLRHVYFSHPHLDHTGFATLLRSDVHVHFGCLSSIIYSAMMESRRERSIESKLYWSDRVKEQRLPRLSVKPFKGGEKIRQDSITVRPFPVDHSVPGSYGFVVETPEGMIAYTGDLRMHGPMAKLTNTFKRVLSSDPPQLLICEGTNIRSGRHGSEAQLRKDAEVIISRSLSRGNRLVMVEVRSSDLDRFNAFHTIGVKLEMNVAVTLRLAYMLKRIEKSNLSSRMERPPPRLGKNVKVLKPHKSHLDWWEKEVLDESGIDVVEEPEVVHPMGKILILDSGRMNVFETPPPRGSLYILSTSEHMDEEEEFGEERFLNTLALQGIVSYRLHTSGHASPLDILEFVDAVKPKRVMPIHTEYPEMFCEVFKEDSSEVTIPEKGVPVTI